MKHFHKPLCNHDCGALRHFFGAAYPEREVAALPFLSQEGRKYLITIAPAVAISPRKAPNLTPLAHFSSC